MGSTEQDIYANSNDNTEILLDFQDSKNVLFFGSNSYKGMSEDEDDTHSIRKNLGGTTSACGRRCSLTPVSVFLLLLCALLLTVVTVMWVKISKMNTEKEQFQTSYNSTNTEGDHLQISNDNVTLQIQFLNNQLLMHKAQLEQQKSILENVILNLGCGFFSSRMYCISNVKKSWSKSRQDCIINGADLVIINSTEEQEFISKRFGSTEAWIGLSDTGIEGIFKWVDNTSLTTEFWWNDEPNDFGFREDCAITGYKLAQSNISTWADYPCDHPVVGICETKIFEHMGVRQLN